MTEFKVCAVGTKSAQPQAQAEPATATVKMSTVGLATQLQQMSASGIDVRTYTKMLDIGIPEAAVRQKLQKDGIKFDLTVLKPEQKHAEKGTVQYTGKHDGLLQLALGISRERRFRCEYSHGCGP